MPALNWDFFMQLPGSAEKNFELLCRGIVRHKFGSDGVFRALANQPGVEFHLRLSKQNELLGEPGRWWGWQCKWYDLAGNRSLGTTRRRDIEDGIRKAEAHLPGLTDWVLWTRHTLTKKDQEWFDELPSRMTLHLWTSDDVDNLLTGQAAVLRDTYFGELVLTPEILDELHERSVAPVRTQWQPEVHHVSEAEHTLRRMLGETDAWSALEALSADLRAYAEAAKNSPPVPSALVPFLESIVEASRCSADTLDRVVQSIRDGDFDLLRDELSAHASALPVDVATALRKLRAGNHCAGLYLTNAVVGCRDAVRLLEEVKKAFSSPVVAVSAPAGCGKTHLAVHLTSPTAVRPHGVLLHGRDLHANDTLDHLARGISIAGRPVPSMEALVAAVNAAGQRARCRLPVLIDGLNEAEDPRKWKRLIASLKPTIARHPYVLLVCTLRPDFVRDALPDETCPLELDDFGEDIDEAVRKYFRYWKIKATDGLLPEFLQHPLLRHPLTLRLFCEVTNPTRQQDVDVRAMPGSLTKLFERYLENVARRIEELAPQMHRFVVDDVRQAIATIANELWKSRKRSIELRELRNLLGDAQRPWDQSLVRALEHEGVLLRRSSNGSDTLVPVHDMLGGHIIASALLAQHNRSSIEKWIKDTSTTALLAGDYEKRHPLADDVLQSLVEQIPRRFHGKQLWQLVEEPLRGDALRRAARIEPAFLDMATVDELLKLVRAGEVELFQRFWEVRGVSDHPLNAEALDRMLRPLTVAERDLLWTEWLRTNQDDVLTQRWSVLHDVERLEQRWRSGEVDARDRLRARWVMWTLTSTVRRLRDQATRALYWFGRSDPEGLFELTIDSLTVNDAYVSERMLAASYGVTMSRQDADASFATCLKPFLERLARALVGASASAPTYHYLARLYVRGIFALAAKFYPSSLPDGWRDGRSFATPTSVDPLESGDERADEVKWTLHIDFKNYTLGRLFDDRRNYDMDHAGHQAAVAHVLGVVWALGWRKAAFEAVDSRIAEDAYRGNRIVERYGKKYCWIGFFTYAGLLEERGLLSRERSTFSDVDIDPSFPEKPPTDGPASIPDAWLSPTVPSDERWLRSGTTFIPRSVLRREVIADHRGPWVAVHGVVNAEDRNLGRKVWAVVSALITDKGNTPELICALNRGVQPRIASHIPSDYYIFAGEIPWHPHFASIELAGQAYRDKVRTDDKEVEVEVLAHQYAWESYHSEMNQAGQVPVPSKLFSTHFELHSAPQSFNQFLPDGSPATITLSGVDGLEGGILYIREDLLHEYVGNRAIVWFAFGRREFLHYPLSPPEWLVDAYRQQANVWRQVLTGI